MCEHTLYVLLLYDPCDPGVDGEKNFHVQSLSICGQWALLAWIRNINTSSISTGWKLNSGLTIQITHWNWRSRSMITTWSEHTISDKMMELAHLKDCLFSSTSNNHRHDAKHLIVEQSGFIKYTVKKIEVNYLN